MCKDIVHTFKNLFYRKSLFFSSTVPVPSVLLLKFNWYVVYVGIHLYVWQHLGCFGGKILKIHYITLKYNVNWWKYYKINHKLSKSCSKPNTNDGAWLAFICISFSWSDVVQEINEILGISHDPASWILGFFKPLSLNLSKARNSSSF